MKNRIDITEELCHHQIIPNILHNYHYVCAQKGDLDHLVARIIKRGDMDNLVAR